MLTLEMLKKENAQLKSQALAQESVIEGLRYYFIKKKILTNHTNIQLILLLQGLKRVNRLAVGQSARAQQAHKVDDRINRL